MSDDWTDTGLTTRGWFKPAVALWFALLLGGGLFLMPASIHASIASATGIGGRVLISALAGVFGLFLGLALAGRLAAAAAPRAIAPGLELHEDDSWTEEATVEEEPRRRRVFSAREDIGEEGIGIVEADMQEEEPAQAFEDILAEIPSAAEPEETWEEDDQPIELGAAEEEVAVSDTYSEVEIEEAEFETIPEPPAPEEITVASEPAVTRALGDLSLPELEDRLAAALASRKRAGAPKTTVPVQDPEPRVEPEEEPGEPVDSDPQIADPDENDPVIAFLRREASRKMPQKEPSPPERDYDAQAALRHALDKLGKVGKPGD